MLGAALANMAKGGTAVVYGATAAPEVTFDIRPFYATGGASLYGFILFHELRSTPAGVGLTRLVRLVVEKKLVPLIDVEAPLDRIGETAAALVERKFVGKAVILF